MASYQAFVVIQITIYLIASSCILPCPDEDWSHINEIVENQNKFVQVKISWQSIFIVNYFLCKQEGFDNQSYFV